MKKYMWLLVAVGVLSGMGYVYADESSANREQAAHDHAEWLLEWRQGLGDVDFKTYDDTGLPEQLDISFKGLGGKTMIWSTPTWFTQYQKLWRDNPTAEKARAFWDKAFDDFERMGVTDVVFNGGFTGRHGCMTGITGVEWELPPLCFPGWSTARPNSFRDLKLEPLKEWAERCQQRGINMWIVMHSLGDYSASGPEIIAAHEHFYARNAQGEIYQPFEGRDGQPIGGIYDFFNEDTYRFIFSQMDWLKEKLEPYGVFKGFVYDEFASWIYDWYEDDIDKFSAFCEKKFGETAPEDISEKFALQRRWNDPNDVWWRRYFLWRMDNITTIHRRMREHVHSLGLKAFDYYIGYHIGLAEDIRRLEESDYVRWNHRQAPYTDAIYMDNGFMLGHLAYSAIHGRNQALFVCGRPAQLFAYGTWINYAYHEDDLPARLLRRGKRFPRALDETAIMFRNVRRWDGARSLCRTALLRYQTGNLLRNPNVKPVHAQDDPVTAALAARRQTRIIDIDLPRYFKDYDALIAVPNAVRSMPAERFAALMDYVKEGGTVISLNTEWSVARRDLTQETDVTVEALGCRYDPEPVTVTDLFVNYTIPGLEGVRLELGEISGRRVSYTLAGVEIAGDILAGMEKSAAITVNRIGKGVVVGVHFDLNSLLADELRLGFDDVYVTLLDRLLKAWGKPAPVRTEGQIQIGKALYKDGDIGITFLGRLDWPNQTAYQGVWALPAHGKVWVSADLLRARKRYTVTRRARGIPEPVAAPNGSEHWTVEELSRAGIPVTIDPRRQFELLEIEAR